MALTASGVVLFAFPQALEYAAGPGEPAQPCAQPCAQQSGHNRGVPKRLAFPFLAPALPKNL